MSWFGRKQPVEPPPLQLAPDIYMFLNSILEDSGMKLDAEMRASMIQELAERFNYFMLGELSDHLSERDMETFARMTAQGRPKAEIERFFFEHIPNAPQIFSNAFVKFREFYLH